jgi:hypothetical protein
MDKQSITNWAKVMFTFNRGMWHNCRRGINVEKIGKNISGFIYEMKSYNK